jgi:NTE family protein
LPRIRDPGPEGGCATSTLRKIVRSVQAFGRELGRERPPAAPPRPKIGLALGGGFARGLSHIGVLKVFEAHNVPIDFIAGTSVGALIGAAYCSGVDAKELEEIAHIVRFRSFARWSLSRFGLASNDRMTGFLNTILKVKTFEELRIPLAVTTTDFLTGDAVVFRSGPLIDPVRASCAYPGMFPPVNVGGRLLVDGLLTHSVPVAPLRAMGADRVVAIYLSAHWVKRSPRHILDVIGQCFSIAQDKMCAVWKPLADVVLEPNVDGFTYDGFERAGDLIRAGEVVAEQAIGQIAKWVETSAPVPAVPAPAKPAPGAALPSSALAKEPAS